MIVLSAELEYVCSRSECQIESGSSGEARKENWPQGKNKRKIRDGEISGQEMQYRRRTYPDRASLESGEMSVLRTQLECPEKEATAPEPGLPDAEEVRTSCRMSRLSSEADMRSCRIVYGQVGLSVGDRPSVRF